MPALDHNTGIEVLDLQSNAAFLARHLRPRDTALQLAGMQRIARTFAESPDDVLQQLSDVAVDLCTADSAGISLEAFDPSGQPIFHWAATSGRYARFLNALLPRHWMPCEVCLDRMQPQLVRVPATHFGAMGVDAEAITDGMLIPWDVDGTRGTIWILAHGRPSAFDSTDYHIMQAFADVAAMAVRHLHEQKLNLERAEAAASAAMAHQLAHQINNPLQKITNSVFLATTHQPEAGVYVKQAADDLRDLSTVVRKLLAVPKVPLGPKPEV